MNKKYYVYLLYSKSKDKYYIGQTANLDDRLRRHNSGRSKSTKSGIPWELLKTISFNSRNEAMKFEYHLKHKKIKGKKLIKLFD
jgi:putative endonuclease